MSDAFGAARFVAAFADLVVQGGDVTAAVHGNLLGEHPVEGVGRLEGLGVDEVDVDVESALPQVACESLQVSVHTETISTQEAGRDMTPYDTELIMRSVTITGTRTTGHRSHHAYAELFAAYLRPFADDTHFYIGGAKGIDSLALAWLAGNTDAYLSVVVPGTVDQQPAEARHAIARTRARIKDVVELRAAELATPAYHARNRWMVDRTSMTIGFPHATEPSTGTWQTLNYTAEQEKARLIVPV